MAGLYGFSREAVRVKVKKCEGNLPPEWRKFSVDPQITSLEVLYSILAKAFDIKSDFGISYRAIDPTNGQEVYLPVLSDYDLDASFLRAHNLSIATSSEPCLNLKVDIKPFSEAAEWESGGGPTITARDVGGTLQQAMITSGQRYVQTVQNRLPGLLFNQMEKTFTMVQRALNLVEDPSISQPPRHPLSDSEFRGFLDSVGQIVHAKELRKVIYIGGIDPSLRRVVWKHILNVYPDGMTGRERMDYMKRKAAEYYRLRDKWKTAVQKGTVVGELAYVTSMVRKDVLRTDRLHPFYAGNDDNQNIASLFNILTTYALNHPGVSYCQGMSDIASPLLVTMNDEAQAYICFCAVMIRLRANFMLDGIAMTKKFAHLSEALQFYDPEFYEYLKLQQADDLLFCYRWLLLEMKREFAFEDSLRMLEVLWSSLPSVPPVKELPLFEKEFEAPPINDAPIPKSPSVIVLRQPRENPYTKICALRRQSSALSLLSSSLTSTPSPNVHAYHAATSPNSVAPNGPPNKLETVKRMNQSLDENVSRDRVVRVMSHQSLDESKMTRETTTDLAIKDELEHDDDVFVGTVSDEEEIGEGLEEDNDSDEDDSIASLQESTNPFIQRSCHESKNAPSREALITKQLSNSKRGGHFKGLKEKIVSGKNGIFDLEASQALAVKKSQIQAKGKKVVKNFNEFLNFAAMNKSRISATVSQRVVDSPKPLIKLTKSSFEEQANERENPTAIDARKLQLNIAEQTTQITDGSSPDDSQEYFPMTTSMTRELRLELENLDRQVFGADFRQFNNNSGCDTPESGDSVDKISEFGEFNYEKLNQKSNDGSVDHYDEPNAPTNDIYSCRSSSSTVNMRNRNRSSGVFDDAAAMKRISSCSANNDIFIWENPLHGSDQTSPQTQTVVTIETHEDNVDGMTLKPREYNCDGEIIEENNLGKKSVTPIRLVRKYEEAGGDSNQNSMDIIETDDSTNWESNLNPTATFLNMTNSCEEASELSASTNAQLKLNKFGGGGFTLPPPHEFGHGNPFLMFLCLTLLLQHRDYVIKSNMDYNEMAMHFDKMVRKHNVIRVLNQARQMYSAYLKGQVECGANKRNLDGINETSGEVNVGGESSDVNT